MNQIPVMPQYPMPMAQQSVPQQPNCNAVKIDIHNPQASTGMIPQSQYAPMTSPIYNYSQAPVYDYPQAQQPIYYYPQSPVVQTPVSQQPAVQVPQQAVCPSCKPVEAQAPIEQMKPASVETTPSEVAQAPVIQQQNINAPEQAKVAQDVPAPKVSEPEVVSPESLKPQLDINEFITRLANPDFEGQASAMEEIANMVKENPEKATDLVDTKVFDALNNIVSFDSSKLEGPSQAQVDARQKIMEGKEVTEEEKTLANTITPKEQAERNKSYALFTIAIMDKLYADEVAKLSNQTVPLTELPEASTMVNQLKDNPNPMVRSSAIEALSYIQKPEYKQDLTTLFTVAKNDKDAGVAQAANAALDKLAQV